MWIVLVDLLDVESIEKLLRYNFKNPELLKQALTHTSTLNQPRKIRRGGNDTLATVGDAVVNLAIAAILYGGSGPVGPFLTSAKGDLTIERSKFVNNDKLAEFSEKMRLRRYLHSTSGQSPREMSTRILAQTYEAIVGAIFLDSDYDSASGFVRRTMMEE
jgi:ribonuclease-3